MLRLSLLCCTTLLSTAVLAEPLSCDQLKADIEHHVREEEDVVFPRLRDKLSADENRNLTNRMNREGFKVA